MENNLLIKQFQEYDITIYGTFDKPLFKAKEVGDLLSIKDINSCIRDFTDRQKGMHTMHTLGGRKKLY